MKTVEELIDEVIVAEGDEFTWDKSDSGGPTKYGITQATLSVALHHNVSPEDVANLTRDQAVVIYKNMYYYAARINSLPEALQPVVFDFGVNAGIGVAATVLQNVLEMLGYECSPDGLIGPETANVALEAYNKYAGTLINAYVEYRIWYYQQLAERSPKDQKFLEGWLKRANSFRVEVQ